ncbi:MAG: protein translocase subunit SecF [Thermoanaerobaculia bacterium]|nr:protein translocase subunit SecF [Thermoanaerobaculia bacterium]
MQFFKNPDFDFLRWRIPVVIASTIFILIGFGVMMTRGLNMGIDFAGGANVVIRFQETPPIAELRDVVADATIQEYGPAENHTLLLRLPQQEIEGDYAGEVVRTLHERFNPEGDERLDLNYQGSDSLAELLQKEAGLSAAQAATVADAIIDHRSDFGIYTDFSQVREVEGVTTAIVGTLEEHTYLGAFNVLGQETVGPQIGAELQRKAALAIILSTLAMGVYIAIRFDIRFGFAAILCLFHDVAVALAFLALIGGEFEIITVAAFLMIIGYSINDTVVVYDRVRENVRKYRGKMEFNELLNLSMNQTLARTIMTTGTTTMAVVCLIVFGGEVINEFSWILLVGALSGTYSTLFVVSTIVLAWNRIVSRRSEKQVGTRRKATASMQNAENRANG